MGQLSGRRFGHTARQFRIERSLRPRFRFPFRCGHNQKRLDNRELRNLFYRKREKDLWEKYSQTSFSLSHRCRIDTNRRWHTRDLWTGVEPPGHVEQILFRSPCTRNPHHAPRIAVSPKFRRHALRARPTIQIFGFQSHIQGYSKIYRQTKRLWISGTTPAGKSSENGVHRDARNKTDMACRRRSVGTDSHSRKIYRLHPNRKRSVRQWHTRIGHFIHERYNTRFDL